MSAPPSTQFEPPFSNFQPTLPPGFDPGKMPVLALHWFGLRPSVGLADLRRQRAVVQLHRLGPRATLEALIAVAAGGELDDVLADFARLDPDIVHALGGDRWPTQIFAVSR